MLEVEDGIAEITASRIIAGVVALLMVKVVGRTRCYQPFRELELLSTGRTPVQLCSSSIPTTVTHSIATEYVALTLKGHPVESACTPTTVLRVLSDFLKRKVNLRGSDSAQSCIAVLKDLKLSNSCPMCRALTTGMGGGVGERDIVMAID